MGIRTVEVPARSRNSVLDVIDQNGSLFYSIACSIIDNCVSDRDVVIVAPREDTALVEEIAKSLQANLLLRRLEIKLSPPIYFGDSVLVIGSRLQQKTKFDGMETVGTWIELSENSARPVYYDPDLTKATNAYSVDAVNFGPASTGNAKTAQSTAWPRNTPMSEEERANMRAVFALSCGYIIRICSHAPMGMHP